VFCVVLFLLGCKLNDGVLRRASGDYFPLRTGSEWRYDRNGTTSIVQVQGDSIAYNYPTTVVLEDFAEQYWIKSEGLVRKFVNRVVNRGGTDYPLEQRYRQFYVLPFVEGQAWSDDFRDTVSVLGETIAYRHQIDGRVVGTTRVGVLAGDFSDCYEVDLNETTVINDSTATSVTQEWYAPGIGLVKRIQDGEEQNLIEYHIP
jgi:hypothetical protein